MSRNPLLHPRMITAITGKHSKRWVVNGASHQADLRLQLILLADQAIGHTLLSLMVEFTNSCVPHKIPQPSQLLRSIIPAAITERAEVHMQPKVLRPCPNSPAARRPLPVLQWEIRHRMPRQKSEHHHEPVPLLFRRASTQLTLQMRA